ncbi:MAG: TrkH family potassium uptake protein [Clostridia bacterium]|nr:TrkH family potassium uptake protein [Clostridia bacterium]
MNYKMILNTTGKVLLTGGILLLLPLLIAIGYLENSALYLGITAFLAILIGFLIVKFIKPNNNVIYSKEGFIIVTLAWLVLSLVGCLPFYLSGQIPSFIDAFFETVSGFTTTGASILNDPSLMDKGLLFWRSFTHWIGGMGIIVFIVAINKKISDSSIHVLRAEMPGPSVDKLVPTAKDTATILYLIYLVLTGLEVILLAFGDMNLFDAIVHALGTAGTGGFGVRADSIASYSAYSQWVIAIFMFLFGINFNLFYLVIIGKIKNVLKSNELITYILIVLLSITVVSINIYPIYENLADVLRLSTFQVTSLMSTTGYSTVNFDAWPTLSKSILILLMFIGGCAGSTAGGFKVSRIVIIFKRIKKELRRIIHPRSVESIKTEGKLIDETTVNGTGTYLAIYVLSFVVVFFLLSLFGGNFAEGVNLFETNFTATLSCLNNIGPGLNGVGPTLNFANYSDASKIVLSFTMLLGRLELYPLLITLSASTWVKH